MAPAELLSFSRLSAKRSMRRMERTMSDSTAASSIEGASRPRDFYTYERTGPTLSVIIPTYRRPLLLAGALESIGASQNCGADDIEVIVVDNSPEAEARAVVARFEARFPFALRYATEARAGVSYARNCSAGLARAR